jgi:hypothetical protein
MSPVTTNYVTDLGNVFVSYADFLAFQSQAIPIVTITQSLLLYGGTYINVPRIYNYYIPQNDFTLNLTQTAIIGFSPYSPWSLVVKTGYTATFTRTSGTGSIPTAQVTFTPGTYTFWYAEVNDLTYTLESIDAV